MARARVFGYVEIVEDCTGSNHGERHAPDAESFERRSLELLEQPLVGTLVGKYPVVELRGQIATGEEFLQPPLVAALHQHLLRSEIAKQFVDIFHRPLGGKEFTGGDVEEGHAGGAACRGVAREVYGCHEVVLLVVEHIVGQRHSGCHQLGDAAFHECLRGLRILELLADGHALACAHQFRQIRVERVVGKTCQLDRSRRAVGAPRQRDAQNLRGRDGVVAERLVEVAHAKQQHRVGVLLLHLEILFHQGCLHHFLSHRFALRRFFDSTPPGRCARRGGSV